MSEKLLPDATADGKTSTDLIVIRHSGLRTVEPTAVLASLDAASLRLPRHEIHLDTSVFKEAVDGGDWSGHVAYLRQQVASIDQAAERCSRPELHYFGLPEVPHAIAAGALLGDERHVHIHEFDRDTDRWAWPARDRTLTLTTSGVPNMPAVTTRGTAILRVSISAAISPADVREVVGDEHLADVEISIDGDRAPGITRVRSEADLEHVRLTFREAFAALRAARPNIELIYLFVAAPVSVCFAIGQELKPRNSPPIQTFRYRSHSEQPSQQCALLLSAEDQGVEPAAITPEELRTIRAARSGPLSYALHDVLNWARRQREEGTPERPWFKPLHLPVLEDCRPYRGLPALHAVVAEGATVDPDGGPGEYAYDKDRHVWRLPDRLVLSWRVTFPDDAQLRRAFRLFLFHEYVHDYQTLTAYDGEGGWKVRRLSSCSRLCREWRLVAWPRLPAAGVCWSRWTGRIPQPTSNWACCSKMTGCSGKEKQPTPASGNCWPPSKAGAMRRSRPSLAACSCSLARLAVPCHGYPIRRVLESGRAHRRAVLRLVGRSCRRPA